MGKRVDGKVAFITGAARPGPVACPPIGGRRCRHHRHGHLWADRLRGLLDVNLTGVYHTAQAAIPHLIAGGRGGAMVRTRSALGIRAMPNVSHHVAAKAGVIGLMRSLPSNSPAWN